MANARERKEHCKRHLIAGKPQERQKESGAGSYKVRFNVSPARDMGPGQVVQP